MPTYSYKCAVCETVRDDDCSMSGFKEHHPLCLTVGCDGVCDYFYVPSVPQVVFKDGTSGWPSKGNRVNAQMKKRSEEAGRRQRERYGTDHSALPNYKGEIAPSWADARSEALIQGGSEQAATYNHKVEAENKKKLIV